MNQKGLAGRDSHMHISCLGGVTRQVRFRLQKSGLQVCVCVCVCVCVYAGGAGANEGWALLDGRRSGGDEGAQVGARVRRGWSVHLNVLALIREASLHCIHTRQNIHTISMFFSNKSSMTATPQRHCMQSHKPILLHTSSSSLRAHWQS